MDIRERIELLARRISELAQQQGTLSRQLVQLIEELETLKKQAGASSTQITAETGTQPVRTIEFAEPIIAPKAATANQPPKAATSRAGSSRLARPSSFEEFIGKNLASKVGILVTIVGIFIGARYAIEHNMVSPMVRIISGYASGLVLIALAILLKKKYEAYSSVLMGGGLAVLYFITYTAYGFYNLMPQLAAFILMLIFTIATVYVSLLYNRVIIAHLALVGAYAIPFLLSDNSGRYFVLFSYITIINVGILFLSFRKTWKSLFYAAFFLTWIIYTIWYLSSYDNPHFYLALAFRVIFFVLFYAVFLAYKLVKKEKYGADAIVILLSNAFLFYAFGYDSLSQSNSFDENMGLFTVINAAIHFGVSLFIRSRLADKALYYLVLGLSIVFVTIAIPVQFDGNWVTLLWIAEAVLMFVIGRTQGAASYEKLSLVLLLLGVTSLAEDWVNYSEKFDIANNNISPFANIIFLTGLLVVVAIGSILYIARSNKYVTAVAEGELFRTYFLSIITVFFLLIAYFVFFLEIQAYFSRFRNDEPDGPFVSWNHEANFFRIVMVFLYSMVFTSIVTAVNHRWTKSSEMRTASMTAIGLLALILIATTLTTLNLLSRYYFFKKDTELHFDAWGFLIRYIVAGVMILLLMQGLRSARQYGEKSLVLQSWQLLIHGSLLALLSAEYLHWSDISGNGKQFDLGLSILWGVYGLYLIIWGIYKKQKHLRLAAIVVFVITLVKLFFYDLRESGTVTKTVSFISLGAILLLVSYLYNRYKDVLFGRDEG